MTFETFWSTSPRKLNKAMALKAYNKAISKGFTSEAIIGGAADYKQRVEVNGIDTHFICHPATFINQERFDNDYGSDRRSQPATGNGYQPQQSAASISLAQSIAAVQKDRERHNNSHGNTSFVGQGSGGQEDDNPYLL